MLTFSLRAGSCNNYYRGHEPSNHSSNCWGYVDHALVFSIEQAREIAAAWRGNRMEIVVSLKEELTFCATDGFERELFCAAGGDWYVFPHRERLASMLECDHALALAQREDSCKHCGAHWCSGHGGFWFDGRTGRTIDEELVI